MAIQKFSLPTLQKIRQHIQTSLMPADSEQHSHAAGLEEAIELPEPTSLDALSDLFKFGTFHHTTKTVPEGRWLVSTVNPADALLRLPGLRLKPGLRLVSYLYRAEKAGAGIVWAVAEPGSTTAHLEQALPRKSNPDHFPKPTGGLPDFMMAIEGNRSPASFLVASLLQRELQEFGALGLRCNWSHHRLIDSIPHALILQVGADHLKGLDPKVRILPDQRAAVEFFTCRVAAPVAVFRHIDLYAADSYQADRLDRPIAGNR